ncbi:hypothetical protein [Sunxiuqinia indica]|uniref:hypothetical protein n=1 Tax=Sunxiuqinia indica TaxID=2692584 RepID=UPI00135C3472|nr:hypothetical protein [Sunxiuqinia indica]
MEAKKELIFQIDSPLVKQYYQNDQNYKILYDESIGVDKKLCAIYFSSNELYYPNTEKAFNFSIVGRDKFEWQRSMIPNVYKHIFFRDLQKQWYIEGINATINSPEKLRELIANETEGYRVYAIGSSAGGYAALIYGSLLQVERVYAFNPQFDLAYIISKSTSLVDPLLFKYKDQSRSSFYRVDNYLNKKTEYFYFQSCKSSIDIAQYENLRNKELVNRIQFSTSNHGFPFLRHNLKYILSLSASELRELSKTVTSPFALSVKVDGFFNSVLIITSAVIKRIKKKLYDEKRNR